MTIRMLVCELSETALHLDIPTSDRVYRGARNDSNYVAAYMVLNSDENILEAAAKNFPSACVFMEIIFHPHFHPNDMLSFRSDGDVRNTYIVGTTHLNHTTGRFLAQAPEGKTFPHDEDEYELSPQEIVLNPTTREPYFTVPEIDESNLAISRGNLLFSKSDLRRLERGLAPKRQFLGLPPQFKH